MIRLALPRAIARPLLQPPRGLRARFLATGATGEPTPPPLPLDGIAPPGGPSTSSSQSPPPPSSSTSSGPGSEDGYRVRLDTRWRGEGTDFDPKSTSPASMILSSSLDLVPAYGWTLQTLQEGARSLGYSASAAGMFPRGGVELAEYFVRRTTGEVRAEMEEDRNLSGLGTTAKVKEGVRRRLLRLRPFVDRWPEALGLMAQPQNAPTALQNLGELVDEIWYVAGDRSVDMNWYSKRVLLAGVYTSTELFMTQDKSEDFTQTDKFLDRRLQDVAFVGKSVAEVNKMATFGLQSAFGVLASRGINIKNPFM